jgi:hypothetical protein
MGSFANGQRVENAATCHSKCPEVGGRNAHCVKQERTNIWMAQSLSQRHGLVANAPTRERLRRAENDGYARARLPGLHKLFE